MNWLYYLAEANLYLAVFYLAYCLLLSGDTHYLLKRIYMVSSCIISFILPVLQISAMRPSHPIKPADTVAYNMIPVPVTSTTVQEPENIKPVEKAVGEYRFTFHEVLWYLYLAGVVALTIRLLIKLYALLKLVREGKSVNEGKYKVICLSGTSVAFSFFKYLFIGTDVPGADTIIRHELVHIRQKHSVDVLFLELLEIVNWFNPIVYLLQNSLKSVHEYIADEQTAAYDTDPLTYSSFLVMNAYGAGGSSITHSFFNDNLLKKRIIMLNQQRSGNLARLKYLVALPIFGALLCVSTLAFSKTYSWVDLSPAKLNSAGRFLVNDAGNSTKRKRLKITKDGISTITDQFSIGKKNEKVTYTVGTITKADKSALLKNHIKVEIVEDSTQFRTKDGRLTLPVVNADGYHQLDHFLHNNIHYATTKGEKGGLVEIGFSLDKDRHIIDAKIAKSGGPKLDALALNGFNAYKGVVTDDSGKNYKIGVYFFTDDYSIFKTDSLGKDPEFAGELIVTNYKYPVDLTSKGYEYHESGIGFPGDDNNTLYAKVLIFEKNGDATWFYKNKMTPADLKLLKDKYGYTFPSASSPIVQMMHVKNANNKRLAYIFDVSSYLDPPYANQFYNEILNSVEYPIQAKKSLTGGVVVLNFNLGNDGIINDVTVSKSAGNGFDEAALNALKAYKSPVKDVAGRHSIAILFCVAEKSYRPAVSSKIKTDGYVGELAVADAKSPFISSFKSK